MKILIYCENKPLIKIATSPRREGLQVGLKYENETFGKAIEGSASFWKDG
ncbi:MAG: hypothetical protein QXE46_04120 [Candidatus Thermoplasmatota archaeon]